VSDLFYSFDQHSVTVFIKDPVFGAISGIDRGSVSLDFTTAIVPEPGTATLGFVAVSSEGIYRLMLWNPSSTAAE
jgi:hypothetical protein